MDSTFIVDSISNFSSQNIRTWMLLAIIIPTIVRVTIFLYIYTFKFRKLIPEKQSIKAVKLIMKLQIPELRIYIKNEIKHSFLPILVSIPILWWFQIKELKFSDFDSYPIVTAFAILFFLGWFIFEISDSFKSYRRLNSLLSELEELPITIKSNIESELTEKLNIPAEWISQAINPMQIIELRLGQQIQDINDLITALEWLLENRTITTSDKNKNTISENKAQNLFNFSIEDISGYIGKFLKMPTEAYNEIIKKIENKVSDYSTTIIEQKIAKSLTITTHYEILNYKISSRVISYFRALWPSVSLTILFHINGLLT